jgi:hypothetical protein
MSPAAREWGLPLFPQKFAANLDGKAARAWGYSSENVRQNHEIIWEKSATQPVVIAGFP